MSFVGTALKLQEHLSEQCVLATTLSLAVTVSTGQVNTTSTYIHICGVSLAEEPTESKGATLLNWSDFLLQQVHKLLKYLPQSGADWTQALKKQKGPLLYL